MAKDWPLLSSIVASARRVVSPGIEKPSITSAPTSVN